MNSGLVKLKIIGIIGSGQYQKCKYYANALNLNLPDVFAPPMFRPMFDIQWTEFLTKNRRNLGGRLWMLKSPVAVFKNGEYLGSDEEFLHFCNVSFNFCIFQNFDKAGDLEVQQFFQKSERIHIYLTISIDGVVVGSLLFELYTDLVPLTCRNFLRLVKKRTKGYKKSPINRIVKTSWIQIGGHNLKKHRIPCENYIVHHDKRGILSMCNSGKHRNNNTQFFISLDRAEWLDYYYVAFGQLIHGEEILQKIEALETKYESPVVPVIVEDCGEYSFDQEPDKKFEQDYEYYLRNVRDYTRYPGQEPSTRSTNREDLIPFVNYPDDVSDCRDVDSVLSESKYQKGLYSNDAPNPYNIIK